MKRLTKLALIFIFAFVVGISGFIIVDNIEKTKEENTVSSLAAGPIVAYTDANTWNAYRAASYSGGGNGLVGTAYKIGTAEELAYMAYTVNNNLGNAATAYYELTANIDLSAHYWLPIGNYRAAVAGVNVANSTFNGNFDGKDFSINGLYIGNPGNPGDPMDPTPTINSNIPHSGLFGRLNGATISNVNIDCYIQSGATTTAYIGGIAGYSLGTVNLNKCRVSGKISVTSTTTIYLAGLVGYTANTININYCSNFADFSSNLQGGSCFTGGLIGWANGATTITYSCNVGNFGDLSFYFRSSSSMGGLIGDTSGIVVIDSCYNAGDINVWSSGNAYSDTGGIIGWARNTFTLKNSFNVGNIRFNGSQYGNSSYGGLVGYCSGGTINNCFSACNIIILCNGVSNEYVAFLVGGGGTPTVTNSFYSSSSTATYNNGANNVNRVGGTGTVPNCGKTDDYLTSEDFVDLLNLNTGGGASWIYTGEYPTLDIGIINLISVDFHYESDLFGPIKITVYQPLSGNCSLPIQPLKEGKDFLGWYENEGGTGFKIEPTTTVEELEQEGIYVFHAHWKTTEQLYTYKVELYDSFNNEIDNSTIIDKLISTTEYEFSQYDPISAAIYLKEAPDSGYRFDYFKILGDSENIKYTSFKNHTADEFADFADTNTDPPTIIIEAYFVRQYALSFLKTENSTVYDSGSLVYTTIGVGGAAYTVRGFFEDLLLDVGTTITINVLTNETVLDILPGNQFELDDDTNIQILIGAGTLTLTFEINPGIPENLLPYLLNKDDDEGSYSFSTGQATNETIAVAHSTVYQLIRYELWFDGALIDDNAFTGQKDVNGYVYGVNIPELLALGGGSVDEIMIKAIYEHIASLSFAYIEGSNSDMGYVEVYKKVGENLTPVTLINGKNVSIKHGDTVVIELISRIGYEYVNINDFEDGVLELVVEGQMKVDIKFQSSEYALSVNNPDSVLNKNNAKINEQIYINLNVGFGFALDSFSLKIGNNEIESKFVELSGNSLSIAMSDEFIEKYGAAKRVDFIVDFTTKMSPLFIVGICGSGALLIAAAILIVIYIIALQKRKEQLRKAEEQARLGKARLSVADQVKHLREED